LSFLLKNLCPEACDSLPGHVLQGFASKLWFCVREKLESLSHLPAERLHTTSRRRLTSEDWIQLLVDDSLRPYTSLRCRGGLPHFGKKSQQSSEAIAREFFYKKKARETFMYTQFRFFFN
jgi:hypothetical protein